jgi:hypothetical protein
MKIDNTEKVKKAQKWLHGGKTPRQTEETTVIKNDESNKQEVIVRNDAQKTI